MSSSHQKPDLEDSINVTEAHGRVEFEAAAAAREKRIVDNGIEPITVWVLAACGAVLVIAGGILGKDGKFFNYASTFKDGYVRQAPEGKANTGPEPKEALAAYMARGAKIYTAKCNGCHGAGAQGDGTNYPPLVGSKWALGETERFAMIILNGLKGPVSSGKSFPGAGMPAQGGGLTPEDLAGVMTYVRNNFGNSKGDVVTVQMAAAAIEISNARAMAGQQVTAEELTADHVKALPGDPIDAKAKVNPLTLLPVKAAKAP
jgi:mono/diheme cytochrome c family protein